MQQPADHVIIPINENEDENPEQMPLVAAAPAPPLIDPETKYRVLSLLLYLATKPLDMTVGGIIGWRYGLNEFYRSSNTLPIGAPIELPPLLNSTQQILCAGLAGVSIFISLFQLWYVRNTDTQLIRGNKPVTFAWRMLESGMIATVMAIILATSAAFTWQKKEQDISVGSLILFLSIATLVVLMVCSMSCIAYSGLLYGVGHPLQHQLQIAPQAPPLNHPQHNYVTMTDIPAAPTVLEYPDPSQLLTKSPFDLLPFETAIEIALYNKAIQFTPNELLGITDPLERKELLQLMMERIGNIVCEKYEKEVMVPHGVTLYIECPLSGSLMVDPVITSTRQVYEHKEILAFMQTRINQSLPLIDGFKNPITKTLDPCGRTIGTILGSVERISLGDVNQYRPAPAAQTRQQLGPE